MDNYIQLDFDTVKQMAEQKIAEIVDLDRFYLAVCSISIEQPCLSDQGKDTPIWHLSYETDLPYSEGDVFSCNVDINDRSKVLTIRSDIFEDLRKGLDYWDI